MSTDRGRKTTEMKTVTLIAAICAFALTLGLVGEAAAQNTYTLEARDINGDVLTADQLADLEIQVVWGGSNLTGGFVSYPTTVNLPSSDVTVTVTTRWRGQGLREFGVRMRAVE